MADEDEYYETVINGSWAPFRLGTYNTHGPSMIRPGVTLTNSASFSWVMPNSLILALTRSVHIIFILLMYVMYKTSQYTFRTFLLRHLSTICILQESNQR